MGGTWIFWPCRKIWKNSDSAILGLNEGENQNFFFTQFIVTLCPKDGLITNFLSDLPFRLQDVLCKRHWNSSFQPQNWDWPPRHCLSPQITTFGLRYLTWMVAFDNATKHALPPKSGFPNIGPLNHQYPYSFEIHFLSFQYRGVLSHKLIP